jgi:hypothetical protein
MAMHGGYQTKLLDSGSSRSDRLRSGVSLAEVLVRNSVAARVGNWTSCLVGGLAALGVHPENDTKEEPRIEWDCLLSRTMNAPESASHEGFDSKKGGSLF